MRDRVIHCSKLRTVQNKFGNVSFLTLYLLTVFFILFERIPIPEIGMSPYRILAGLLLVIMFVEMLRRKQILITGEIILFIFMLLLTSLIGLEERNIPTFLTYVFMSIMLVILYNLFMMMNFSKRMFVHLSVLSTVMVLIGSLTLLTDYFGITKFTLLFGQEIYEGVVKHGRGAGILGGETNISASRMCALLPFSFYLLIYVKETRMGLKPFVACTIVVTIVALVLTGSRMGLLALSLLILLIGVTEFRRRAFLAKIGIAVGLMAAVVILGFSLKLLKDQTTSMSRLESLASISELRTAQYEDIDVDESILQRFLLIWIGVDLIRENPLLGIGIGNAKYLSVEYFPIESQMKYLHNTFLDIGAENGLIMLGVLIFVLVGIQVSNSRISKKSGDPLYYYFALAFYIQLFCWLFLSDFSNKLFWNLFLPLGLYLKNGSILENP